MTADDGFADWLRANPAPDLQGLVARHGGYDKITPEAWAEYDRAMADWQERRRRRSEGGRPAGAAADFENSINECYREVRARVAAGGEGWKPAAGPAAPLGVRIFGSGAGD
jgi:hypothetical protein